MNRKLAADHRRHPHLLAPLAPRRPSLIRRSRVVRQHDRRAPLYSISIISPASASIVTKKNKSFRTIGPM